MLTRCYQLSIATGGMIMIKENTGGLIFDFSCNDSKRMLLENADIKDLLKAIDMLRPERDSGK